MHRNSRFPSWRTQAVIAAAVVTMLALGVTGWLTWRPGPGGEPRPAAVTTGLVRNGTFDTGKEPWGSSTTMPSAVVDGRLCADVPGKTSKPYDLTVTQNDLTLVKGQAYEWTFSASGSPDGRVLRAVVGLGAAPYDTYFEDNPELAAAPKTYRYTFVSPVDTRQGQVAFQVGGSAEPWRFCVDDVSLVGGAKVAPFRPDTGPQVRVNQVAYLAKGPKNATVVTPATEPQPWQLKDAKGGTVARGRTVPRGVDGASGQNTHTIDFSSYRTRGAGFTLVADGEASRPFDIGAELYEQLATDALKFFYTQRSGIEIQDVLRPGYARPAAHIGTAPNQGDTTVACQPKVCDYTLDVRGGWYDAGDHGKYVVNGGISAWQLMNQFERTTLVESADAARLDDGRLAIPESDNDVPDILDEARWELEFMLRMQVPPGRPKAGMVHHKVHDEKWTTLPLMPDADPQKRELHPPSTAATLNLAAVAAQAGRLFRRYDPRFAARSLAAAKTAWNAATADPRVYAPASDNVGGGPYDDNDVTDEFYWATAELYLSTGEMEYADRVRASKHHTADVFRPLGFSWKDTAALGRLAIATAPNDLADTARVRRTVVDGADGYLRAMRSQAYGLPYAPPGNKYDWGSNSGVLNNMIVLATAYDLTGEARYRDAVLEAMGYLLGRNALNISFVTGYGDVYARNQHSRWYAHQLDQTMPNPPHGTLAGGPNSSIQDPVAQVKLAGCVGQFCYLDDIGSWSTNELTINWNAPLAWIASFIADQ